MGPQQACCDNRVMCKDIWTYICVSCGQCEGQVIIPFESREFNKNDFMKAKTRHSRTRWFNNMMFKFVYTDDDRAAISNDFEQLVRCYEKHKLLKGRNMSIYGWYITKLAERRGIELRGTPRDIKTPKIREEYTKRYNKALKLLGWRTKI